MTKPIIVIIGAGPGGESAAKQSVKMGAETILIEKQDLGGVCLNRGCIPSKTLLEAGRFLSQSRQVAPYFDGTAQLKIRWKELQEKKTKIVSSIREGLDQKLKRLGVKVYKGRAVFIDSNRVLVDGDKNKEEIYFDTAVVAAGSTPFFPTPFQGIREKILNSDGALSLSEIPKSLIVVGGGAVGCEFACLFHEMGCRVSIVEKTSGLLPGEDPGIVRLLQNSFLKRGIQVFTDTTVEEIESKNGHWSCVLNDKTLLEAEKVLVCVGRRPNGSSLGLEAAGVSVEEGKIPVDLELRTNQKHIFAVGDINGYSLLAHAASVQGEVAVENALGGKKRYPHELVPRCLYTWPEVASVGEWANSLSEKGIKSKAQRFFFQGLAKAMAGNETEGMIQVLSDKANGQLMGAQIIGPHATELIHIFSVALKSNMTLDDLKSVIYAHPTLSEGIKEALSR